MRDSFVDDYLKVWAIVEVTACVGFLVVYGAAWVVRVMF